MALSAVFILDPNTEEFLKKDIVYHLRVIIGAIVLGVIIAGLAIIPWKLIRAIKGH